MSEIHLDSRHITGYPYWVNTRGHVYSEITDKILSTKKIDSQGRVSSNLWNNEGYKSFMNHKLVVMMFPELIRRKELHETYPDIYHEIDHIDGNPSNNRVENLRWCKSGENKCNSRIRKTSKTGIKGIQKTPSGTYHTYIGKDMKKFNKNFKTVEEAETYMHNLRLQLHGEFARD